MTSAKSLQDLESKYAQLQNNIKNNFDVMSKLQEAVSNLQKTMLQNVKNSETKNTPEGKSPTLVRVSDAEIRKLMWGSNSPDYNLGESKADKNTRELAANPECVPEFKGNDLLTFFFNKILRFARDNSQTSPIQISKWIHHVFRNMNIYDRVMWAVDKALDETLKKRPVDFLISLYHGLCPRRRTIDASDAKRHPDESLLNVVLKYGRLVYALKAPFDWLYFAECLADNDPDSHVKYKLYSQISKTKDLDFESMIHIAQKIDKIYRLDKLKLPAHREPIQINSFRIEGPSQRNSISKREPMQINSIRISSYDQSTSNLNQTC